MESYCTCIVPRKHLRRVNLACMPSLASTDLTSFSSHLRSSQRIVALVGAGLSASSGIPTYRGGGGLWREHDVKKIATPWAFEDDPLTVWEFYAERKHEAIQAKPNSAHYALAELARKRDGFLMISQNIDDLCERAGHPSDQFYRLHGSLFALRCSSCDYAELNNSDDYLHAAQEISPTIGQLDRSTLEAILPRCPRCAHRFLRPGVVWYGEKLPSVTLSAIEEWFSVGQVDLMLVIGTSSSGYGPAEFIELARQHGARIAVVNADDNDATAAGLDEDDWYFVGDAAAILPTILQSVIGRGMSSVSDAELLRLCDRPLEVLSVIEYGHKVLKLSDSIAVKIGASKQEAENQSIAWALLDQTVVRVPAVYRFFEHNGRGYLFMKYIDGTILESCNDARRIKQLADVLAYMTQITGPKIGPLAGGPVYGQLWSEDSIFSPLRMNDIENYYNRILSKRANAGQLELSHYQPRFCHLDVALRNIIWLPNGSICLIDWQSAGFYPHFFERCMLQVNVRAEGDFNTKLQLCMPQLEAHEEAQRDLIFVAWSIIQRSYCGPPLKPVLRRSDKTPVENTSRQHSLPEPGQ